MAELTKRDLDHLRMLAIGHYVLAAFSFVFGTVFIGLIPIGVALLEGVLEDPETPPELGWLYIGLGAFAWLACWVYGALAIAAGRSLRARRRWTFCIVMAAMSFTGFQPVGPALAVLTIVVLIRPAVRAAFERKGGSSSTPVRF